jgi:nucleotide-binding universal stress UspA family protein
VIPDDNIDLVVMGASSHSKIEEFLVGSTTKKVVRSSKVPVLTIHEKPSTKLFKNIVYATSLSDEEIAFSDVIKFAQEIYDATVHIVRINTRSNFIADTSIKEIMASFAERVQLKKYTLNIFNDFNEEDGILHFANVVGGDLIGMATHGRTGVASVLAGSISEDVINNSKKPVLTFLMK